MSLESFENMAIGHQKLICSYFKKKNKLKLDVQQTTQIMDTKK